MKMVVLGTGIVGSAAVWDLLRRGHDVVVADADASVASATGARFDVPWRAVDVEDGASLAPVLTDADAVVSAVPYRYGTAVAAAAIETGTHYLDFGGNPSVVAAQRGLDDAAAEAGVLVVPDCGLAPGVANVMATLLIEQHRSVHPAVPIGSVQIRVGALPQEPVGTLGYQLAFNPAGLINEYAEPCEILRDGRYATVDPLTRFEDVEWNGWGPLEAFSTAGGTSSLCTVYAGVVGDLEYKTLRFPGHGRIFAAMRENGLFDETVGPSGVAPRTVLLDALDAHLPRGGADVVLVRTWLTAGDTIVTIEFEDVASGGFSALARTTAFPATALADLIVSGSVDVRGVRTMNECAPGEQLLSELDSVGIRVDHTRFG
ncbi:MAG: saccharopine dehydrogenase NADP-binding domain-containing protein [Acidimicrobiia bacterium]|nr:saccharopine dehydrogenase NADP-binding domain-containing protein [Acidimicrobiia bacterium]